MENSGEKGKITAGLYMLLPRKAVPLIQDDVYRELTNKRHGHQWDCPNYVELSLPFAELNDDLLFGMAHPRKKAPKFLHMLRENKFMRFVEVCENY